MDTEIKHFTYMAVEMLITSLILGVIVVIMSVSSMFLQAKENKDLSEQLLQVQADLYPYVQQGDKVSTSDVIDIITTYAKIYDFVLVKSQGDTMNTGDIYLKLTSRDSLDKWSMTNIRNKIGLIPMLDKGDGSMPNPYANATWRLVQIVTPDKDSRIAIVFFDTYNGLSGSNLDNVINSNINFLKGQLSINYNVGIK